MTPPCENNENPQASNQRPCKPVLARPPERKNEEDSENDAGDLGRDNIEAASYQTCADEAAAEVSFT